MDLLGKVESLLGEVIERAFRSSSQFTPLDLDRSLRQELDRSTKRVLGRVFAPNRVRIHLGARDREDHRTLLDEVQAQITRSVVRHADHRGWTFLSPFALSFDEDPDLTPGNYRFEMGFERATGENQGDDGRQAGPAEALFRLVGRGPAARTVTADLAGGTFWTLGRDPACDVVLDDSEVSARHAKILPLPGGLVIEDLNSTNGVRINGVLTRSGPLAPGDRIELGQTRLILETVKKV